VFRMGEARLFPVRTNGGADTILMSADELMEAAQQGRLMIAPQEALRSLDGAAPPAREEERAYDRSVPPIEQRIAEIVSRVPPEAWEGLPDDLTENLDHYIYGTPKRS